MSKVVYVNDAEFKTVVLSADKPVLLDFWAEWCGPCRAIAPTLDDLAEEFDGKAIVAKLNIDDNPETPAQFGVRSIPTLLIIKEGQVVETLVGALPKADFANALNQHI